jgi:hypothetical protein
MGYATTWRSNNSPIAEQVEPTSAQIDPANIRHDGGNDMDIENSGGLLLPSILFLAICGPPAMSAFTPLSGVEPTSTRGLIGATRRPSLIVK